MILISFIGTSFLSCQTNANECCYSIEEIRKKAKELNIEGWIFENEKTLKNSYKTLTDITKENADVMLIHHKKHKEYHYDYYGFINDILKISTIKEFYDVLESHPIMLARTIRGFKNEEEFNKEKAYRLANPSEFLILIPNAGQRYPSILHKSDIASIEFFKKSHSQVNKEYRP